MMLVAVAQALLPRDLVVAHRNAHRHLSAIANRAETGRKIIFLGAIGLIAVAAVAFGLIAAV